MSKLLLTLLATATLLLAQNTHRSIVIPNVPDAPKEYPKGKLGEMVKLGEAIIEKTNTHPLSKEYVGNSLQCTSCHLQNGKTKTVGTFIGTATVFPAYSSREDSIQTLQDRIDNCFMRSMNGKRPPIDSKVSIAMATYVTWLSTGLPIKMSDEKTVTPYYSHIWPDKNIVEKIKKATNTTYKEGKKLYAKKCSMCHGENGAGVGTMPPLWGDKSYNAGAGLSKLHKLATWMEYNMPYNQATLNDDEAVALAIYIDAQPRPSFNLKDHLLDKDAGVYNSKVKSSTGSVRDNFKAFGLDIDKIRGDKVIN
ncbi:MAG: c-type cytochrome [Campylobacterales bacterium]